MAYKVATSLFVYTQESVDLSIYDLEFVISSGFAARNRGNVAEIGSNEDSDAVTTFVRTTDPLRACSIY